MSFGSSLGPFSLRIECEYRRDFCTTWEVNVPWWALRAEPWGGDVGLLVETEDGARMLVSAADFQGYDWIHASVSRRGRTPSYADLVRLKELAFGPDRYAYQVFPPESKHVNIHPNCLHLWGRLDGTQALPEFSKEGSI